MVSKLGPNTGWGKLDLFDVFVHPICTDKILKILGKKSGKVIKILMVQLTPLAPPPK